MPGSHRSPNLNIAFHLTIFLSKNAERPPKLIGGLSGESIYSAGVAAASAA